MLLNLDKHLSRTMERREFLMYSGALVLTVVGVSGLLKALSSAPNEAGHLLDSLSQKQKRKFDSIRHPAVSYGRGGYGGKSRI